MGNRNNSSRVFVSHAFADKEYVDGFVNNILIRGAGLRAEDIFYSSSPDTGVASGRYLMQAVHAEANESSLIIALVTPVYQTRPVCVAELGAAWVRSVLFPLMAPSMERTDLEGVLPGLTIRSADDEGALNGLANELGKIMEDPINMQSWGVGLEGWLSFLRNNPNAVANPERPTAEQVRQLKQEISDLQTDLTNVRNALDESEKERGELLERFEELKQAKSRSDVSKASRPKGEVEAFEALRKAVHNALAKLPEEVSRVLRHSIADRKASLPDFYSEHTRYMRALKEVDSGRLVLDEETNCLELNIEFPDVKRALDAVTELHEYLDESMRTEEFLEYFTEQFDVPMDMSTEACWDAII